jgi:site-specific DNA-cytosine methylase
MRSVALCEIEAFAIANLVAKMEAGLMDPAPIWTDLKTFPWDSFRDRVDILSGGYPCQPFSSAGKRAGADDPRHLWPFIADSIQVVRPKLCFFENVEGHISLGLSSVISDLEEMGYQVSWAIFSAAECGAPHQRKRVFILAHRNGERGFLSDWRQLATEQMPVSNGTARRDVWPARPGQQQYAWEPPRVVGNASNNDWRHMQKRSSALRPELTSRRKTECTLGGNFNESSSWLDYAKLCVTCDNRTDELRLLGNGVVPATAELAFRTLINEIQITAAS